MKKSLRDQWCLELRSGKYPQGRSRLRTFDDKFCCWGVLCDIMNPNELSQETPRCAGKSWCWDDQGLMITLDMLKSLLGEQTYLGTELATMNDNGVSFPEIADFIEKNIVVTED